MANYKVVFNPKFDTGSGGEFEKKCASLEIAKATLDAIADFTLFLHEKYLMRDHTNYGYILVEDEDGEWVEYEEPEDTADNHPKDAHPTCTPKKVEQDTPKIWQVTAFGLEWAKSWYVRAITKEDAKTWVEHRIYRGTQPNGYYINAVNDSVGSVFGNDNTGDKVTTVI